MVRYGVKYRNGILQDMDRPLNPKSRKVNENTVASKYGLSRSNSNVPLVDDDEPQNDDSFSIRKQQVRSETLDRLKGKKYAI